MLGGLAMKCRWRKKCERAGAAANKPNLVCGPVQQLYVEITRKFVPAASSSMLEKMSSLR